MGQKGFNVYASSTAINSWVIVNLHTTYINSPCTQEVQSYFNRKNNREHIHKEKEPGIGSYISGFCSKSDIP